MSYHREYAEHLLTNPPVDEFGRHLPSTIIAHCLLAVIDKLDEMALFPAEEEDE